MNKEIGNYIKRHTTLVTTVVVGVFLFLAVGEYVLYRREMQLNKMVSEGLMQLKETVRNQALKNAVFLQEGKLMLRRSGITSALVQPLTLNDGSHVALDGTVARKDGTKVVLKEGQGVDLDGVLVPNLLE